MSVVGISYAQPTSPFDGERQRLLDTMRENLKNDFPDRDLSQREIESVIAAVANVLDKSTKEAQIAAMQSERKKFNDAGKEDLESAFKFVLQRLDEGKYGGFGVEWGWGHFRLYWW